MIQVLTDAGGMAVLAATLAFMLRARRRSKAPAWMTPRHCAGLAAGGALVTAAAMLDGYWLLAAGVGAVTAGEAVIGAQALATARRPRRVSEDGND